MKSLYSHPTEKGLYGIFNDSFPPIIDGVTLTVENYATWLSKAGRTPCIVTPWNPATPTKPYSVMRFLSLPIHNRHPYRYGYPKLDPFIWKRLSRTNFRLLHSHCPFSSGRLAVYVKKQQHIPLIGTFHSKYKADLKHSFRHMSWCVPIIMKRILNFFNACDEVWIPQARVEETVRQYGYKGKLTVVENGNDFSDIIGENTDIRKYKEEAKARLNFDPDKLNLLFVGQHIWEKGLDVIFNTLKEIDGKINFNMTFIGDGYATDDMKNMLNKEGLGKNVAFKGVITDRDILSDYYAASDLFVFPSFYDNAPLVLREAAAMVTPSILLKGSTASEVVRDGYNGFIADNQPQEIGDLLCNLNSDRNKIMNVGINARNSLVRSWKDVVDEVMDRYDSLLRRSGK